MVPACVPGVMDELSILSLQVERMPADPKQEFNDVHNSPYLSVCTTAPTIPLPCDNGGRRTAAKLSGITQRCLDAMARLPSTSRLM